MPPEATAISTDFNRLKDCRHGRMLYNLNDIYVGRSLDLYGEFSEGEVDVFRQVLRPGDVVMDAGANIGALTIPMARIVGEQGAVLAFEPQRFSFQLLCANVALNNLLNVWCHQAALGEVAGTVRVPDLDPRRPNNFGGLPLAGETRGAPIPMMRADSFPVPTLRLLKVDVEGMELAVLKGALGLIQRFSPALYVENDRPDLAGDLVQFIDSLGYDAFWHGPPLYSPRNFFNNPQNVFGDVVSVNMLCVPRRTSSEIQGLARVEVPKRGA